MAIAFVTSTAGTIGTAASTWSLAFPTGLTNGGAFVIGIGCNTGVTVNSVADATANAYSSVARANSPSTSAAELWWTNNASTAGGRIQIGLSGASSGSIAIGHWTGISTANGFRSAGSSAINANSTSHGASQITGEASALIVSYARLTASTIGTLTALDGMTAWASTSATGAGRQFGMYKILGGASTNTGSFTTSSGCQHAGVVAAFSDTVTVIFNPGWPSFTMVGIQ